MDECIEVLKLSDDGDDLSPHDLALVQFVANGGLDKLSQTGHERWGRLLRDLRTGAYRRSWLYGIEHLTQDHQGYVFWKGRQVEHYSFSDPDKGRAAAKELASVCRLLEHRGEEVTASAVSAMFDRIFWATGPGLNYDKGLLFYVVDTRGARLKMRRYCTEQERHDVLRVNLMCLSREWEVPLSAVCYSRITIREHWQDAQDALERSWTWAQRVLHTSGQRASSGWLCRNATARALQALQPTLDLPERIVIQDETLQATGFQGEE